MPAVLGDGVFVSIDGNDLSEPTDSLDWGDDSVIVGVGGFGSVRRKYKQGVGDGTVTMSGTYHSGATGPAAVLLPIKDARSEVALIYRPEGTGSGKPQRSVNVLVKSYSESAPYADRIKWSVELQMSGDVTRTTQA